nr:hypothetical protein [bacterium]
MVSATVRKPPVPERIAFIGSTKGYIEVFVVDADGANRRQLTEKNTDHIPGFYGGPVWSPDGTRVAFQTDDREGEGDTEISVAYIDGSGVTRLTDNDWPDNSPVKVFQQQRRLSSQEPLRESASRLWGSSNGVGERPSGVFLGVVAAQRRAANHSRRAPG